MSSTIVLMGYSWINKNKQWSIRSGYMKEYGGYGQSSWISGTLDLKQSWNPLHSTSQLWFGGDRHLKTSVVKVLFTPVGGQGSPYGPNWEYALKKRKDQTRYILRLLWNINISERKMRNNDLETLTFMSRHFNETMTILIRIFSILVHWKF